MQSFGFYPARAPSYLNTRWETWNRFRPGSSFASSNTNVQRIRGTSGCSFSKDKRRDTSFDLGSYSSTRTNSVNEYPKGVESRRECLLIEKLPQKYRYYSCINRIDVVGQQVACRKESGERNKAAKDNLKKKIRGICCKLPLVSFNNSWHHSCNGNDGCQSKPLLIK